MDQIVIGVGWVACSTLLALQRDACGDAGVSHFLGAVALTMVALALCAAAILLATRRRKASGSREAPSPVEAPPPLPDVRMPAGFHAARHHVEVDRQMDRRPARPVVRSVQ